MSFNTDQINICKKGNLQDIISLIYQGYDQNIILDYVSEFGHFEIVKYLIEDCGVNMRANYNWAVRFASQYGHFEIVKYLIEKYGANIIDNGIILSACRGGYFEVVKYLLETCVLDKKVYINGAVGAGSKYGHLEMVKYLVEKCGANVRTVNNYGVRYACRYGHLEVVKYLVEKCRANVRADNDCAVRCASLNDHFEVVKYLVEKCGAILPEVNSKYERYLIVYEKGEKKMRCIMAKRIYFWWVQMCYNPNFICGQRSMYKGYREYMSIR